MQHAFHLCDECACIVLGHITDKDGKKESKSKGNYVTPDVIYDAVRMDFAVWDRGDAVEPAPGIVFIAKEDIEGLDLQDGARINLRRPDRLDVAREVVRIASGGLRKRNKLSRAGDDETGFLAVLQDIADRGETQAEEKLAKFHTSWNGSVDPVFREYAY